MPVGLVAPLNRRDEKLFCDKWMESSGRRAVRDTLCHAGDLAFKLNPANPFVMQFSEKMAPITKSAVNYNQLTGIRDKAFMDNGKGRQFENLQSFFKSYEGRSIFCRNVKNNFKGFMNPSVCNEVTAGGFVKNTLVKDNVKSFVNPITEGKICSGIVKSSFAGLTLWGVISKTRKNYCENKSIKEAIITFFKESFKSLLTWEAGTIGCILGSALMPVTGLAAIAGILGASLASAISYKILNRIIP